jgi:hypothetical protein
VSRFVRYPIGEPEPMQKNFNRVFSAGLLLIALIVDSQPPSFAGFGNLFGDDAKAFTAPTAQGQMVGPDSETSLLKSQATMNATNPPPTSSADFSTNCEVTKPRFSRRVANARRNIDKGQMLMQSCGDDHTKAEYKKGKVMKEIGEKDLAVLKLDNRYTSESSSDTDNETKTTVTQ